MNKTISVAIRIAIDVYEEKKKDILNERKEQNIQRIRSILKKYRIMKECLGLEMETTETYGEDILEEKIPEIMERFDKALMLLNYIYSQLGQPEDKRCYQIIMDVYITKDVDEGQNYLRGEDRISLIAEKYNINKRTVYKDIAKASQMLSLLYFGILD